MLFMSTNVSLEDYYYYYYYYYYYCYGINKLTAACGRIGFDTSPCKLLTFNKNIYGVITEKNDL
jgi:hypothetical protein